MINNKMPTPFIRTGSSNGGGFLPPQIPGLTLWLDASDENTITLDFFGNIQTWEDKSGNGNNQTSNVNFKPRYSRASTGDGINGLNAVDTTLGYLAGNSLLDLMTLSEGTMLVSFKITGVPQSSPLIEDLDAIMGSATNGVGIHIDPSYITYAFNFDGDEDSVGETASPGLSNIFTWVHGGGNLQGAIDTNALAITPSGDTSQAFGFFIGATNFGLGGAPLNSFKGRIGEIMIFDNQISAASLALARNYLTRWLEPVPANAYTTPLGDPYYSDEFEIYTED